MLNVSVTVFYLSPIHTADANETKLSSCVSSASGVCNVREFATSSRRLPTDSAIKLTADSYLVDALVLLFVAINLLVCLIYKPVGDMVRSLIVASPL